MGMSSFLLPLSLIMLVDYLLIGAMTSTLLRCSFGHMDKIEQECGIAPEQQPSQVLQGLATTYKDEHAMKKLASTVGPIPGWSGSDFCIWSGVICNSNGFVTSISLPSQNLSGTLPSLINSLSQLTLISLKNNQLSGPLPSFSNLTLLQEVHLQSNNFTSIPKGAFSGLSHLRIISLHDNPNLSPWPFPAELIGSPNLVALYARNVNLIGPLPDIFGFLTTLENISLSYNNLIGPLPRSLHGTQVNNLWLGNQLVGLSGTLEVLEGMSFLKQVWLHQNNFSGPIPDLSKSPGILDLQLQNNQLTGLVPPSVMSLPKLANISLQNNKLQGPLPIFPKSTAVSLEMNMFCKDVPGTCDAQVTTLLEIVRAFGFPLKIANAWQGNDACKQWLFVTCDASGNVTTLNLSKQGFNGTISPALPNLKFLRELYLDNNNLNGTIPTTLNTMHWLKILDLSNNNLQGPVPTFRSSVTVLTGGNLHIGNEMSNSTGRSKDTNIASKGNAQNAKILLQVLVPTFIVVILFTILFTYKLIKYRAQTRKKAYQLSSSVHIATDFPIRMAYHALEMATNNFDIERKLGEGGFGTVFEGTLSDGARIAVKRLDHSRQGMKEFLAEVQTIGSIHHVNLVKLVGFCAEKAHRLLIYEHMSNGSLDKWIFRTNSREELSWNTKKKIMLHIAKGLSYLHEGCQKRIAHLDVKPENVLLDKDFNAKLSDFGLAKLIDKDQSHVITQMRGTRGYLAPEWLGRQITEKVDVYSYGVVVLEIVFGRKNLDLSQPEESNLLIHKVKMNAEASRWSDLLENGSELMHHNAEELGKTIKLAIWCLHTEPTQRPSMSIVVKVLEGAMIPENSNDYTVKVETRNVNLISNGSTELSCSVLSEPR